MPWYKIVELVTLAALVVGVMMRAAWLARVRVLGIDIGGSQEPDEDGDAALTAPAGRPGGTSAHSCC